MNEFWAAIAGAVVGAATTGMVTYWLQLMALRQAKTQRDEDRKLEHEALANSLLIKVLRIHTNLYGIHRWIEECFEEASARNFRGEPWQFVCPLANPPEPVRFSSDELGLLLGQRNDEVFNLVASLDYVHNGILPVVTSYNSKRVELGERIAAISNIQQADGPLFGGIASERDMQALRPRMFDLNSMAESIRVHAGADFTECDAVLYKLHSLLKERLGLRHKLAPKATTATTTTPTPPSVAGATPESS